MLEFPNRKLPLWSESRNSFICLFFLCIVPIQHELIWMSAQQKPEGHNKIPSSNFLCISFCPALFIIQLHRKPSQPGEHNRSRPHLLQGAKKPVSDVFLSAYSDFYFNPNNCTRPQIWVGLPSGCELITVCRYELTACRWMLRWRRGWTNRKWCSSVQSSEGWMGNL